MTDLNIQLQNIAKINQILKDTFKIETKGSKQLKHQLTTLQSIIDEYELTTPHIQTVMQIITLIQANLAYAKLRKHDIPDYKENASLINDSLKMLRMDIIKDKALDFDFTKNILKSNENNYLEKLNRELGDIYTTALYYQTKNVVPQG